MLVAYATTDRALEYNMLRGRSDWAALPLAEQEAALVIASDTIDAHLYIGGQVPGQRRKFPRKINKGALPLEVVDACCEEAYTQACDTVEQEARRRAREGLTSISVGAFSKGYAHSPESAGTSGGMWSDTARALLRPWLLGSAVITV